MAYTRYVYLFSVTECVCVCEPFSQQLCKQKDESHAQTYKVTNYVFLAATKSVEYDGGLIFSLCYVYETHDD